MDLTPEVLALGLAWYAVFVLSTSLHEAAHAWSAWKLGDRTAYEGGQVTLSPLPHMQREPIGMILVPILSYLAGGWMIGWASAPYDPYWAIRYPKRAALMALAGPAANLLLVLISMILVRVGLAVGVFEVPEWVSFSQIVIGREGFAHGAATLLSILFTLNVVLFAFNLLPLPPLDGSGALRLFLSSSAAARYYDLMRQPAFSLIGLLIAWRVFPHIFRPLRMLILRVLYFDA